MLKKAALIFGVVLVLVGILGFIPALRPDDKLLGIFHVNTLHNIIHLVSGLVALWVANTSASASKTYFAVFGVIYALVAIMGFVKGDGDIFGIIANNAADTWLHVVIAVASLVLGFGVQEEEA